MPACKAYSSITQIRERERTANVPPHQHSVSQKPLKELLLIFPPTVPLDGVGTRVWKKLSKLWLVISPPPPGARTGRLGRKEGNIQEETLIHLLLANCSPLQSSKYPSPTPSKQEGYDIVFGVKPPKELPAPCLCSTWHASASSSRTLLWT